MLIGSYQTEHPELLWHNTGRSASRVAFIRHFTCPPTVSYSEQVLRHYGTKEALLSHIPAYLSYREMVNRPIENPIAEGYRTRSFTFEFAHSPRGGFEAYQRGERMCLRVPEGVPQDSYTVQAFAMQALGNVLDAEAKAYLPDRLLELARPYGVRPTRINVKRMHGRWGSCSSSGTINISSNVMLLEARLVDLILLHELTHMAHPDHSAAFWDTLSQRYGEDARAAQRRIAPQMLNIPRIY